MSDEDKAYLIEHFHNTPDQELADHLGISVFTVKSNRTKLGLKKDKEYISNLNKERAIKCGNGKRINTPEAYAKRVVTMQKKMDADRLRIKWGMEQKTKRHYRLEPVAKLSQRNRLKRLGYIIDEKNLVAYWTEETHRAPRIERVPRGTKKGTIRAYYSFEKWIG